MQTSGFAGQLHNAKCLFDIHLADSQRYLLLLLPRKDLVSGQTMEKHYQDNYVATWGCCLAWRLGHVWVSSGMHNNSSVELTELLEVPTAPVTPEGAGQWPNNGKHLSCQVECNNLVTLFDMRTGT